jgi:hypothetical protein
MGGPHRRLHRFQHRGADRPVGRMQHGRTDGLGAGEEVLEPHVAERTAR